MAWIEGVRTVAIERAGPVVTAVLLGLISIPFVAAGVFPEPMAAEYVSTRRPPVDIGAALLLTACAVIPAAIVGGSLAGPLVRSRPATAVLVAMASSWPIAISLLPLAASVLGIRMVAAVVCIDACTDELTSADPLSGAGAYLSSVVVGNSIGGAGILAAIIGGIGWTFARRGPALGRVVLVIVVYAAVHFWSVLYGWVPFVCLVLGTVAWVAWLRWRAPLDDRMEDPPDMPARRLTMAGGPARRSR